VNKNLKFIYIFLLLSNLSCDNNGNNNFYLLTENIGAINSILLDLIKTNGYFQIEEIRYSFKNRIKLDNNIMNQYIDVITNVIFPKITGINFPVL